MTEGQETNPRGKSTKEIRPVMIENKNPKNRFTYLKGRKINAFFQVFEAFWILSGRADCKPLTLFNSNMEQFSDGNGFYNASYGERMRFWGQNLSHGRVYDPVDQLADVVRKLVDDPSTRKATICLTNPTFDNSKYTIDGENKDIACNEIIDFKIRNNKLDVVVYNRANDLHYGTYGANLCQFTTIQEMVLSFLRNSGNESLKNLELGSYYQITNSLHVYLDDYGYACTEQIRSHDFTPLNFDFNSPIPKIDMSFEQFSRLVTWYWTTIHPVIESDKELPSGYNHLIEAINTLYDIKFMDMYHRNMLITAISYRLSKLDVFTEALTLLKEVYDNSLLASCLYFWKQKVHKTNDRVITKIYEELANSVIEPIADTEFKAYMTEYLLGE